MGVVYPVERRIWLVRLKGDSFMNTRIRRTVLIGVFTVIVAFGAHATAPAAYGCGGMNTGNCRKTAGDRGTIILVSEIRAALAGLSALLVL
jgi:hypothetical protein